MARPKKVKAVESSPVYKAVLIVLGRKYEAVGDTIPVAIAGLNPKNCKGKAILSVSNGAVVKERVIPSIVAFRLFNTSGISKEIALKQISNLFQGI